MSSKAFVVSALAATLMAVLSSPAAADLSRLRGLAATSSAASSSSCQLCESQLEKCVEANSNKNTSNEKVPSFLLIQTAETCAITLGNDGKYYFKTSDMNPTTWAFSNRPFRFETALPTAEFFEDFSGMHIDDDLILGNATGVTTTTSANLTAPNAAFTFSQGGTISSPVVVQLLSASADNSTASPSIGKAVVQYTYKLGQSSDQEDDMSLESLFNGTDSSGQGVELDNCSLFIDSYGVRCHDGDNHEGCAYGYHGQNGNAGGGTVTKNNGWKHNNNWQSSSD